MQKGSGGRLIVLSAAFGYSAKDLVPFIRSLKHYSPKSHLVLFHENNNLTFESEVKKHDSNLEIVIPPESKLRQIFWKNKTRRNLYGRAIGAYVRYILKKSKTVPSFATSVLHISLARYFYAKKWLLKFGNKSDTILLSDVRDVIFQGDPLTQFSCDFCTGLEDVTISQCRHNIRWINNLYGPSAVTRLGNYRILCSGVTIGKHATVLRYLDLMCRQIIARFHRLPYKPGFDQGIHNQVLYSTPNFSVSHAHNGEPFLATLHHSDLATFHFDEGKGLRTANGENVCIIHQYDRHERIRSWCQQRWNSNKYFDPLGREELATGVVNR